MLACRRVMGMKAARRSGQRAPLRRTAVAPASFCITLKPPHVDDRKWPRVCENPVREASHRSGVAKHSYLNRVQSSRRLERECQRNVELMWLTRRLAPDFKS